MTPNKLYETLESIKGLLMPIAGQDWHGKWRIQKAIELCDQSNKPSDKDIDR